MSALAGDLGQMGSLFLRLAAIVTICTVWDIRKRDVRIIGLSSPCSSLLQSLKPRADRSTDR
jgi:hypothetical protein